MSLHWNRRYALASFSCVKCNKTEYKQGEIRTTGSGISRFLNLQNQKFITISCTGCGYTEIFRRDGSGIGNIFDVLGG
ncbi:zinc ribbon domain-containing protein [Dehalococcoidia bacterium]|nr:zinc ribbon domain-containing protein [Dehalococcoidia bacterium]